MFSAYCFSLSCNVLNWFVTCSQLEVSFSGCNVIALIAAGRKTFAGEKCEWSSSEKDRGASEKLITSNFVAFLCMIV